MVGWTDVALVSLLALGSAVVVGILGFLIDKTSDKSERVNDKPQEDRR